MFPGNHTRFILDEFADKRALPLGSFLLETSTATPDTEVIIPDAFATDFREVSGEEYFSNESIAARLQAAA